MKFAGEHICTGSFADGRACTAKAYFITKQKALRCGRHSKDGCRTKLPVNEEAKERKYAEILASAEKAMQRNARLGQVGQVTLGEKMQMRQNPVCPEGWLMVFPNFQHGGRRDGWGIPSLSPKYMGPVDSRMPGVPVARTLEQFWQNCKCFPFEVDKQGNPTPSFYSVRDRQMTEFQKNPDRHKFPDLRARLGKHANVNIPLFHLFFDASGKERRFAYIDARPFYCCWYEHFAKDNSHFHALRKKIASGYNLMIMGYDAHPPGQRTPMDWFLDGSTPFGHEYVLFCMLTMDPVDYPWRRHMREHQELYDGVFLP